MPFALLIIGMVLLVSAVRGTTDELFRLLMGDFRGPGNFTYWAAAILIIGSIGYIPKAKPVSTALLGLVVLVLFLARGNPGAGGGFFGKFTEGLKVTDTAKAPASSQEPSLIVGPGRVIEGLQPLSPLVH